MLAILTQIPEAPLSKQALVVVDRLKLAVLRRLTATESTLPNVDLQE